MTFYERDRSSARGSQSEARCTNCGLHTDSHDRTRDPRGICSLPATRLGLFGADNPWNKWLEKHDPKALHERASTVMDIDDELRDPGQKEALR